MSLRLLVTAAALTSAGCTALFLAFARRAPSLPDHLERTADAALRLADTPPPTRSERVVAAADAYLAAHPEVDSDAYWVDRLAGTICSHTTRTTGGRLLGCVMTPHHEGGHYMRPTAPTGADR